MHYLVTGFGPFGPHTTNPSLQVAESLARTLALDGEVARWLELPVDFDAVQRWPRPEPPGAGHRLRIVHIGLAASRSAVSLERCARNRRGRGADRAALDGAHPRLEDDAPDLRRTRWDLEALAARLARETELPVEISEDAGDYVCNATYWHSLATTDGRDDVETIFVHIPFVDARAAERLGRALARALRPSEAAS